MSDIVERLRAEARILGRDDDETKIFTLQCGIMREAANEIAKLREEHLCPIGLDASPSICSAGVCTMCLASRLKSSIEERDRLRKELEEAKAFIADTYGDEEKPRYTTRRMRMEMERAREQALEEAADTVGKMGKIEEFDWAGRPKRREPRRSEFAAAIRRLKESKP